MFDWFYPRAFLALSLALLFLCTQPASAEVLNFDNLLSVALKNSFDIKISQEDIQAGHANVREAKADYYPQLSVRFSNEYVHAFKQQTEVASGGDVALADESSYRHSLITSLSYNLYDFGVRSMIVENARRQVHILDLQKQQKYLDIRREILERYSRGLKFQKQIETAQAVFERQNSIFRLTKQLRQAGTVGRESISTAALGLAETLHQQNELKIQFQDTLNSLTFYTRRSYHVDEVQLDSLILPQEVATPLTLNDSPEVKIYREQIESKKTELTMVKQAMLPKLMIYGFHRMFGSNKDDFSQSLSDLNSRDASISLTFEWPIFSGFSDFAKKTRLNHEISSLYCQKQKKQAELQQKISSATLSYETYRSVEKNRLRQLSQIIAEQDDAESLATQQITDQISFQRKMIELARQRLNVELREVDYATTALSLHFMKKVVQ